MYLKVKLLLFFLIGFCFVSVAQDYQVQLEEAKQLYDESKFLAAAEKYETILAESGKTSFEIYYNIGNAYFKADKLPNAILNYERAKKLSPENEDLLFNLEIANKQVVDRFEKVPELGISKFYRSFISIMPSNIWAFVSILTFGVALFASAFFLTNNNLATKKTSLSFAIIAFILSFFTFLFATNQKDIVLMQVEAVIFAPNVTASSAPNEQSTTLFVLHEGTKVQVLEKQQNWIRIKISDGNIGWLPAGDVEII